MWLTKGTISSFQSSKEKEVVLKKISPGFDSYLLTQRVKLKLIKSTNLIYQVKPAGPQAVPHTLAEKELTEKGCQPESQPASLILKAKFTQKWKIFHCTLILKPGQPHVFISFSVEYKRKQWSSLYCGSKWWSSANLTSKHFTGDYLPLGREQASQFWVMVEGKPKHAKNYCILSTVDTILFSDMGLWCKLLSTWQHRVFNVMDTCFSSCKLCLVRWTWYVPLGCEIESYY